ncbi:hypothetical protein K439DRAFT_249599 [Ramaria rubella]|nr:hypothetical protein K439DRAFT_249599 [Ramaria rubella]
MSYPAIPLFQTIPAVYAFPPSKQQKRRTATNIMAGCFDPLPMLPSELDRDDMSNSRVPSVAPVETDEHVRAVANHAGPRRVGVVKKGKVLSVPKLGRQVTMMGRGFEDGKGKRVKPAHAEEKENAVSDVESGGSLSSVPPSPVHLDPPQVELPKSIPKASGFWRARSSNASVSPVPSTLKRKRSSVLPDDKPAFPAADELAVKKSRLSESARAKSNSRVLYSSSPSLESSASLSSLVSESSDGIPHLHPDFTEEFKKTAQSYYDEDPLVLDSFHCRICHRIMSSLPQTELHLTSTHLKFILRDLEDSKSQSFTKRTRGPRKNVAVKKGWKGWVEEDLEPQKLILLDKPEVLPERTTRSGRKID